MEANELYKSIQASASLHNSSKDKDNEEEKFDSEEVEPIQEEDIQTQNDKPLIEKEESPMK